MMTLYRYVGTAKFACFHRSNTGKDSMLYSWARNQFLPVMATNCFSINSGICGTRFSNSSHDYLTCWHAKIIIRAALGQSSCSSNLLPRHHATKLHAQISRKALVH